MSSFKNKLEIIQNDTLDEIAETSVNFIKGGKVALSCGSTYTAIYPIWAEKLGTTNVEFFPADERKVPIDHEGSNWGLISKTLFDPLGDKTSKYNFAVSGEQFEKLLKSKFTTEMPVFDVIYLGIGGDGHTCSLFPGGDYLDDETSWVFETDSPLPPPRRITLGPGVVKAAKEVVVIINGTGKKDIYQKVIAGDISLPIVRVLSLRDNSKVIIDSAIL